MSLQRTLPPKLSTDVENAPLSERECLELSGDMSGLSELISQRDSMYETVRKLNDGTSGKIYLIKVKEETKPDRLVACKVICKRKASTQFVEKFLPRELQVLARISNPHCIQVHRVIDTETKCFIFMRYAEKGDLYEYLSSHGRLQEGHARFWLRQLTLAIKYLHSMNVAHRDIKCENILVTDKLNVKLADFGFCRYWSQQPNDHSLGDEPIEQMSETYCGSLHYAAPEILAGTPYRLRYVDVWSLGIVLFVMLNGRFPFIGRSITNIRRKQLAKSFEFKPSVLRTISLEAVNVVDLLLEPDTNKRMTVPSLLNCKWMRVDPRLMAILPEIEPPERGEYE